MKKLLTGLIVLLLYSVLQGQKAIPFADSVLLSHVPKLTIPDGYRSTDLPYKVDNSVYPFLRPIFEQDGASCGQAASMGYHFTYEMDRKRMVPANLPENQYPTHFTWNFMNDGYYDPWLYGQGVSYFHSFSILKELGCPNVADYGGMWKRGDSTRWMNGYDLYYNSMKNRIEGLYAIDVSTPDGLITLKHWLYDHLEGSEVGGVANFYTGIIFPYTLPQGTPEAGKAVIIEWYPEATHALTIVGYNDSIRFDYNGDGHYTNNLDINNDGAVTMRDWEIGGLKFVNSYGEGWGDSGFCYMMYKTLAEVYGNGGIWNNTVHVLKLRDPYDPLLTMKITLRHTSREKIKVMAGVSPDTSLHLPSNIMEFPVFNYQGGDLYMQGGWDEEDKTIEFGLDITPLLSYIQPGIPARFFLLVDEDDPINEADGEVSAFSVIDYLGGISETVSMDAPCTLNENDQTMLSVIKGIDLDKVSVTDEVISVIVPDEPYSYQLKATGGTLPYTWHERLEYTSTPLQGLYPMINGEELIPNQSHNGYTVRKLDFPFPFFGIFYDSVYVYTSGCIMFHRQDNFWPYVLDMELFIKSNQLISPFLAESLMRMPANDDGIWYEGSSQYAIFRWNLTDMENPSSSSYDFALKLFPDGVMEYYYGEFIWRNYPNWIAGFSNGDGTNTTITAKGKEQPPTVLQSIRFTPFHLPPGLQLSETGLIHGTPRQSHQIIDFQVSVTDFNRISDSRSIQLTPSLLINPHVLAGSDGLISRNENITIDLEVINHTSILIDSVTFHASVNDPYLSLNQTDQLLENLLPGQLQTIPAAMTLVAGPETPDEHSFILETLFITPNDTLEKKLFLKVAAPELHLGDILVEDGDNQKLEPGETATLMIKVNNDGHDKATSVMVSLLCNDPYLAINQETTLPYGDIPARNFRFSSLNITANTNTPNGHLAEFTAVISDSFGEAHTTHFLLQTGTTPVLIVDLDDKKNSGPVIQENIALYGIQSDYATYLPWWDLYKYKAVFLCLGVFPFNHELTMDEGDDLATYLLEGGNLYMEGSTTWFLDDHTAVHDLFSLQGKSQGWPTGIDTLTGEAATFTENMQFAYSGENTRMDNLLPIAPALSIFHEKTTGYCYAVAHQGDTYHTVGTSFELGGLTDTQAPSTKPELVRQILDFFGVAIHALAANFIADNPEINTHQSIAFTNLSTEDVTSWSWSFPGGTPSVSSESHPQVTYDSAGVFDVILTVSNGSENNTLIKKNYITVISGTGIAYQKPESALHIYPNPSSGLLFLESPTVVRDFELQIFNQLGECVFYSQNKLSESGLYCIDLQGLPPGIYLVLLKNNETCYAEKLVLIH